MWDIPVKCGERLQNKANCKTWGFRTPRIFNVQKRTQGHVISMMIKFRQRFEQNLGK